MRFKKHLPVSVLLISSLYLLILSVSDKLDLYIHPRYILFTTVMAIIGGVMVITSHILNPAHNNEPFTYNLWPLMVVLACAVLLPARSLTSATVSQRTVSNTVASTPEAQTSTADLFAQSSRILSISDWSRLLATNTDEAYYANKTATVSGFIYDADLGADTVWLARFVVTCCAIDAQPVGVPVRIEGWSDQYRQDDWVEVTGTFSQQDTAAGPQLVLVPETVNAIEEPNNPYAN